MFRRESTAIEIASSMQSGLLESAHNEHNREEQKRLEAAGYLSEAAAAFEAAGMFRHAEAATVLTEAVMKRGGCAEPKHDKKREPTKIEKEVWAHYGDISYAEEDDYQENLEERFLDMVLGEDRPPEDDLTKTEKIVEENEADDLNMIDELFEDV